jgi:hypothetical protein
MDKKEKYYSYVVEDLIKNTEIDYEQGKIKLPFYYRYIFFSSSLLHTFLTPLPPSPYLHTFSRFSKHVIERYGVHDEEIKIIWNLYKEKIQPLIKKYE